MSFGSRLKEQRERCGLTQKQLAEKLGVTQGAVGNYESGLSSMKAELLYKIFDILDCDANFLFQDEMNQKSASQFSIEEQTHIKKYRVLDAHGKDMVDTVLEKEYDRVMSPAIEEVSGNQAKTSLLFFEFPASAGTGENLPEEEKRYIMMPKRLVPNYADCCIRVSGNSMEPNYCDGDIVFVQLAESIPVGSIGIFTLNGDGYIKKLGHNQLISLNPNYAPISFGDGDSIRCVGRVLGVADKNMMK